MDSDNHPITLCLLSSQSPPTFYNVLRTFHRPSECISPTGFGFCYVVLSKAQLPNPLRVLSKTQPRLDDEYTCGRLNRLTDHYFGYGLLVIGYGQEHVALPLFMPLTFRLIASCLIASSPLISNLSPCLQAVFWRRCHRQMQERYEVARVKTNGQFGRTS